MREDWWHTHTDMIMGRTYNFWCSKNVLIAIVWQPKNWKTRNVWESSAPVYHSWTWPQSWHICLMWRNVPYVCLTTLVELLHSSHLVNREGNVVSNIMGHFQFWCYYLHGVRTYHHHQVNKQIPDLWYLTLILFPCSDRNYGTLNSTVLILQWLCLYFYNRSKSDFCSWCNGYICVSS
jgi:hypothetical protein